MLRLVPRFAGILSTVRTDSRVVQLFGVVARYASAGQPRKPSADIAGAEQPKRTRSPKASKSEAPAATTPAAATESLGEEVNTAAVTATSLTYQEYLQKVQVIAETDNPTAAVAVVRDMDAAGVKPDVWIYNAAISACTDIGDVKTLNKLFEDMTAKGIKPDVNSFNLLLNTELTAASNAAFARLKDMKAAGVNPDLSTFRILIRSSRSRVPEHFETASKILTDMHAAGEQPGQDAVRNLMRMFRLSGHTLKGQALLQRLGWRNAVSLNIKSPKKAGSSAAKKAAAAAGDDIDVLSGDEAEQAAISKAASNAEDDDDDDMDDEDAKLLHESDSDNRSDDEGEEDDRPSSKRPVSKLSGGLHPGRGRLTSDQTTTIHKMRTERPPKPQPKPLRGDMFEEEENSHADKKPKYGKPGNKQQHTGDRGDRGDRGERKERHWEPSSSLRSTGGGGAQPWRKDNKKPSGDDKWSKNKSFKPNYVSKGAKGGSWAADKPREKGNVRSWEPKGKGGEAGNNGWWYKKVKK